MAVCASRSKWEHYPAVGVSGSSLDTTAHIHGLKEVLMDIVGLVVNAIAGAVGGGASGAALKEKGLGTAGNIIAGLVGGVAGGALIQKLGFLVTAAESSGFDVATLAGQAV